MDESETRYTRYFPALVEGDEDLGGDEPLKRRPYASLAVQLDDDWIVAYRLIPQGDQLIVAEVRIFPGQLNMFSGPEPDEQTWARPIPDRGLTARGLRQIPLGKHLRLAQKEAAQEERMFESAPPSFQRFAWPLERDRRRPGPKGWPDQHYAKIAAAYVDALAGGSRRPVNDATEFLKKQGLPYSKDRIRDAVSEARRRGLLTPAQRGRAGGRLTDRAQKLLEKERLVGPSPLNAASVDGDLAGGGRRPIQDDVPAHDAVDADTPTGDHPLD